MQICPQAENVWVESAGESGSWDSPESHIDKLFGFTLSHQPLLEQGMASQLRPLEMPFLSSENSNSGAAKAGAMVGSPG